MRKTAVFYVCNILLLMSLFCGCEEKQESNPSVSLSVSDTVTTLDCVDVAVDASELDNDSYLALYLDDSLLATFDSIPYETEVCFTDDSIWQHMIVARAYNSDDEIIAVDSVAVQQISVMVSVTDTITTLDCVGAVIDASLLDEDSYLALYLDDSLITTFHDVPYETEVCFPDDSIWQHMIVVRIYNSEDEMITADSLVVQHLHAKLALTDTIAYYITDDIMIYVDVQPQNILQHIEFLVDSESIYNDPAAPWRCPINFSERPLGVYDVYAICYFDGFQISTDTLRVYRRDGEGEQSVRCSFGLQALQVELRNPDGRWIRQRNYGCTIEGIIVNNRFSQLISSSTDDHKYSLKFNLSPDMTQVDTLLYTDIRYSFSFARRVLTKVWIGSLPMDGSSDFRFALSGEIIDERLFDVDYEEGYCDSYYGVYNREVWLSDYWSTTGTQVYLEIEILGQ